MLIHLNLFLHTEFKLKASSNVVSKMHVTHIKLLTELLHLSNITNEYKNHLKGYSYIH